MKHFLALALIVAVASATLKPTAIPAELAQIAEIVAAINHPSTDPATAALLEQMLQESLAIFNPGGVSVGPAIVDQAPEQIAVGPAIVDNELSPISVGPALVDFPLPDGGAVTAVDPTPAVVPPAQAPAAPAASAPLVQIILNINSDAAVPDTPAANPNPAVPEISVPEPSPVHIVDTAPVIIPDPVVLPEAPEPVVVVEPEPVIVVELPEPEAPAPEPVIVGTPTLPEPVVVGEPALPIAPEVILPEALN